MKAKLRIIRIIETVLQLTILPLCVYGTWAYAYGRYAYGMGMLEENFLNAAGRWASNYELPAIALAACAVAAIILT